MRLLNTFHFDYDNIGDLVSSPLNYFAFAANEFCGAIKNSSKLPSADSVIFGGGGLLGNEFELEINSLAKRISGRKILWGVGYNRHTYPFRFIRSLDGWEQTKGLIRRLLRAAGLKGASNWEQQLRIAGHSYPLISSEFDLVGLRDHSSLHEWVPCPSCMHPVFDEARIIPPAHRILIIEHPLFFAIKHPQHPTISNLGNRFTKIIKRIASAKVLVTSSYHAAYWGILLNRKVVVVPWSTKFLYFKWPVEMLFELDGFQISVAKAKRFPNALKEAREANMNFSTRVAKALGTEVTPRTQSEVF